MSDEGGFMKVKYIIIYLILHVIYLSSNITFAARHRPHPPQYTSPAYPDPSIGSVRNPGSIFPDSSLEAKPFIGTTPNPSNRVINRSQGEE